MCPTILFEEHFSNNHRQWVESANDARRLAVTDGHYVIESKVKDAGWYTYTTVPVAITQHQNFKIACKTSKIEGVNDFLYGLIWGLKDQDNFYYFAITGDGRFAVIKKQEKQFMSLIPLSLPNSVNKFDAVNTLAMEKEGEQMTFYINDIFVGQAPFEPLFGNRIGFIVYNKQTIAFDDLVVTVQIK